MSTRIGMRVIKEKLEHELDNQHRSCIGFGVYKHLFVSSFHWSCYQLTTTNTTWYNSRNSTNKQIFKNNNIKQSRP
jgi:hypothetical protein